MHPRTAYGIRYSGRGNRKEQAEVVFLDRIEAPDFRRRWCEAVYQQDGMAERAPCTGTCISGRRRGTSVKAGRMGRKGRRSLIGLEDWRYSYEEKKMDGTFYGTCLDGNSIGRVWQGR